MTTTTSPQTMLADLYRRARTLASEDTAQPGPAAALYEATTALFDDAAGVAGGGERVAPEDRRLETIRERIRRIAIVALRRQALAARQAWVDAGGPAAGTDAQATAALAQALAFGEAALKLHRDGDPARESTQRVVAFLQSTLAIAKSPLKVMRPAQAAPVASPAPSVPSPEPTASSSPPESSEMTEPPARASAASPQPPPPDPRVEAAVFIAGEPPSEDEARSPAAGRERGRSPVRARRPGMVPVLAAIAVAGFLAGFVVAPRIWRGGASTRSEVRIAPPAVLPSPAAQHADPHAPAGAPGSNATARPAAGAPAGGTTAAPGPVAKATQGAVLTPASAAKIAIVLRSEPSGAQVFIGGVWQGATPLRLEQPAGAQLRLTVRRGSRVWRGTLQVGERSGQVLTIRLPDSGSVTARSTPAPPPPTPAATPAPAATVVNRRAHFEGLMAQGVELYRSGWYGPAMARFRAASAVRPDDPSPYLWYARAAVRVGRTAEARRALERVIAIAPTSNAAREAQALLNRLK